MVLPGGRDGGVLVPFMGGGLFVPPGGGGMGGRLVLVTGGLLVPVFPEPPEPEPEPGRGVMARTDAVTAMPAMMATARLVCVFILFCFGYYFPAGRVVY